MTDGSEQADLELLDHPERLERLRVSPRKTFAPTPPVMVIVSVFLSGVTSIFPSSVLALPRVNGAMHFSSPRRPNSKVGPAAKAACR